MTCWRCQSRDEVDEFGLCKECDEQLHTDYTIPPGTHLHPPATMPEDIKAYFPPPPHVYQTIPTGTVTEITDR